MFLSLFILKPLVMHSGASCPEVVESFSVLDYVLGHCDVSSPLLAHSSSICLTINRRSGNSAAFIGPVLGKPELSDSHKRVEQYLARWRGCASVHRLSPKSDVREKSDAFCTYSLTISERLCRIVLLHRWQSQELAFIIVKKHLPRDKVSILSGMNQAWHSDKHHAPGGL